MRPGGLTTKTTIFVPTSRVDATLSSSVLKKSKNIFAENVKEIFGDLSRMVLIIGK
jgi:hypothetical protein